MTVLVLVVMVSLFVWMVVAMCRTRMNRQVTLDEGVMHMGAPPSTWMLTRGTHGGF